MQVQGGGELWLGAAGTLNYLVGGRLITGGDEQETGGDEEKLGCDEYRGA